MIEDHIPNLENIAEFLELEGFSIITACNGIDGLQMALDQRPDLIISDIKLPGYDGFTILKHIRCNALTINTPFIFYSAKSERKEIEYGFFSGANDYLVKPCELNRLLSSIHVLLK